MKDEVKKILTQEFGEQVTVDSSDGVHFSATVVSEKFKGLNRVKQQQLVMSLFKAEIDSGKIHALSLKTAEKE